MNVFINHVSIFLPNAPVGNDEMEAVLGQINGRKSRARPTILRSNGIVNRHYALERETGKLTHDNAQLTAEVVRKLLAATGLTEKSIALLACGTASPDQLMPAHGFMVQGELKLPPTEVFTAMGSCTASMAALKHAALSVGSGNTRNAVVTGSELLSPLMQGKHFGPELDDRIKALEANPHVAFEYEFLRWMLSDGAGAALLENEPRPRGNLPSLKIEWIESVSFAGHLETCMYHLARKDEGGRTQSWKQVEPAEWLKGGFFNLGQDARMLAQHIGPFMGDALQSVLQKREIPNGRVDWLLPHISSAFFKTEVTQQLARIGLKVDEERVFTNLSTVGNVGSASVFLMLEELLRSGRAKKGERILCAVPESARFNASFALLEVV
jgi:3-oxoacyl-[acyl-carrier-protein] synthase III